MQSSGCKRRNSQAKRNLGNTYSKTLSKGPAGQHTQAFNNSPSCKVLDGFCLLELQGRTFIKFFLAAFIGLTVKLGPRKRKMASIGRQYIKQTSGDTNLTLIPTGKGRTNTYSPPPTIHHPHRWVDQLALDLRLMAQQRLFKMLFCNAIRTQQTARVAPMPMRTSGSKFPSLLLQIGKAKQVAGSNPFRGQQVTNTTPEPLPRALNFTASFKADLTKPLETVWN